MKDRRQRQSDFKLANSDLLSMIRQQVSSGQNLADIFWKRRIHSLLSEGDIPAVIHQILVKEMHYAYLSGNLKDGADPGKHTLKPNGSLKRMDTVICFFQSEGDTVLINPLSEKQWRQLGTVKTDDLVVAYTRSLINDPNSRDSEIKLLRNLIDSLCNGPGKKDENAPSREAENLQDGESQFKVTPKYAVTVTNGFFHYGNVEAWQNIVESYLYTYPEQKIMLFHNNKQVHKIASLFKWGKVMVGDKIYFSIAGKNTKDIAKLKKYLSIGASPRFAVFLKKNVNSILSLF